jgi:hypothetical protein
MKNLNTLLRDAEPVSREPGLSAAAVADLRRAMLVAAHAAPVRTVFWGRQLAMAACLAVMVLTGIIAAHRVPTAAVRDVPTPAASSSAQRTQVHFSTPGGTRIIWTLDPAFQLRETMK